MWPKDCDDSSLFVHRLSCLNRGGSKSAFYSNFVESIRYEIYEFLMDNYDMPDEDRYKTERVMTKQEKHATSDQLIQEKQYQRWSRYYSLFFRTFVQLQL